MNAALNSACLPGPALVERVRAKVAPLDAQPAAPLCSDYDLNPGTDGLRGRSLRPAAVLLPIVEREDGATMLFTKRTAHLNAHAGQVSFPGGRLEPQDDGPVAAALRETHEETGIAPEFVSVVGLLDVYETVTRFTVTPVVGFVYPGFELAPDPFEVDEVFEVPLSNLMDPANHEVGVRMRDGIERRYYRFAHERYDIWGATAGMLMNFYRRVFAA